MEGSRAVFDCPGVVVGDEVLHRLEAALEKFPVTVAVVELPRHHADCCAPGRAAAAARLPWGSVRNVAGFRVLACLDITDPFVVECCHIEVGEDHRHRDLTVSGVRKPFPVRAVGGHAGMHVVQLGLPPDLLDTAEEVV